jgi:hypothetical protein
MDFFDTVHSIIYAKIFYKSINLNYTKLQFL